VTVCFEEGMQMVVFFCLFLSFFFSLVKLDLGLCVCVVVGQRVCYKTYLLCSSRVEVCV
jgi:hypothetical protein